MTPGEGPDAHATTAALREGSLTRLQEGFRHHVGVASAMPQWDDRDEMISLAPFIDCARRLGHDPAAVLGPIAATGAPWLRETFDRFARRSDVTLAVFGWSIRETPQGPAYRFEWPSSTRISSTRQKKRPSIGSTIGGILVGFDQQVFKTVPPAMESVHHARPDAPVPTKDGGLLVILPSEPRDAEASDTDEGGIGPTT